MELVEPDSSLTAGPDVSSGRRAPVSCPDDLWSYLYAAKTFLRYCSNSISGIIYLQVCTISRRTSAIILFSRTEGARIMKFTAAADESLTSREKRFSTKNEEIPAG